MTERWDCLCAGIIVADQVCEPIAAFPPQGNLVLTPKLTFAIGGCAANVAVDMAKLGLSVGIRGCVGADLFGRALADMLSAEGVDCQGLVSAADRPTSGTMIINVKGEDRRFIHCIGANALFDGTQVTDADLARTRLLYVGGYCLLDELSPERVIHLFQRARAAGVITILDVVIGGRQNCWDWVAPVLRWTDYFLPNHDEARVISGVDEPWEQARRFRMAGCGTVIITCGGDGAIYDGPAGRYHAGVFQVPLVDPTGTGDAFVAGFTYGLLKGVSPEECLKYGTALGASCVQALGATAGVFSAQEMSEFLATHPLPVTAKA